jgi:hypothetical protein
MGMDFVALIRYPGPAAVEAAIRRLEAEEPSEFRAVVALGLRTGWAFAAHLYGRGWVSNTDDNPVQDRPQLPSLDHALRFNSSFWLTFGADTVRVYHLLRWRRFLIEPVWQLAMLNAVRSLCTRLNATDCVITSDFHPADQAFFDGASFAEALAAGGPEDGEVPTLADLYREWVPEEYADSIFKPTRDGSFRQIWWDREWPIPEGWELVTTWDSKGYWRFDWRSL